MTRKMTPRLGALTLAAMLAAPAAAQVTTPPPKSPETGEAYTPPARRAPVRANQGDGRGQIARAPVPRHDPLAKLGEDGYIIRLERLTDEVALERNPYIGETKNQPINDLRVERRARMERQVIENLDLFVELETGLIDTIRLSDIEGMQKVAQMIQPLIADPTLAHELREQGILTRIQAESTSGIVRQYQTAINEELKQRFPDEHLDQFMRFIMHESMKEARLAYLALLEEGASKIDQLRKADISANAASAIANVNTANKLYTALAQTSVEDHQGVLNAIIALRDDPTRPPVEPIDFAVGKTTQKIGETQFERQPDGSLKIRGGQIERDEDGKAPEDG